MISIIKCGMNVESFTTPQRIVSISRLVNTIARLELKFKTEILTETETLFYEEAAEEVSAYYRDEGKGLFTELANVSTSDIHVIYRPNPFGQNEIVNVVELEIINQDENDL